MAYLVQLSQFNMEYQFPNVLDMNSKAVAEANLYIDKYGRELMRQVLGTAQYNELDALLVNGILPDTDTSKWKEFVYGNDDTWLGIENVLIPYVFYHFIYDQVSYVSGVGEVRSEAKNTFSANSTQRLTKTWNEFVCYYGNMVCYLGKSEDFERKCYHYYHFKNQLGL